MNNLQLEATITIAFNSMVMIIKAPQSIKRIHWCSQEG